MRQLIAVVLLVGMGFLLIHRTETASAAALVYDKAHTMEVAAGRDAGSFGFRLVAERYPFSDVALTARERLARLSWAQDADEADASDVGASVSAPPTDPAWVDGDPWVGVLALAVLALVLALHGVVMSRSRVRGPSFFVALLGAALLVVTQTDSGAAALYRESPDLAATVYAWFPVASSALLALACVLQCVPLRRAPGAGTFVRRPSVGGRGRRAGAGARVV